MNCYTVDIVDNIQTYQIFNTSMAARVGVDHVMRKLAQLPPATDAKDQSSLAYRSGGVRVPVRD